MSRSCRATVIHTSKTITRTYREVHDIYDKVETIFTTEEGILIVPSLHQRRTKRVFILRDFGTRGLSLIIVTSRARGHVVVCRKK